jgi:hypothetical protein
MAMGRNSRTADKACGKHKGRRDAALHVHLDRDNDRRRSRAVPVVFGQFCASGDNSWRLCAADNIPFCHDKAAKEQRRVAAAKTAAASACHKTARLENQLVYRQSPAAVPAAEHHFFLVDDVYGRPDLFAAVCDAFQVWALENSDN